jgi:CheY-like chemotaxis protein
MLTQATSMLHYHFDPDASADGALALDPVDLKILIVNEDMRCADSLQRKLNDLGYHTMLTAYSGRRALAVVAEYSPSVVLLDLELPDMTGFQLAARFRSHLLDGVRNVPMVAIAELPGTRNAVRTKAAGFLGCLAKPVDPGALNALLLELQPTLYS